MARWASRISLVIFFIFLGIVMVEKQSTQFQTQIRTSRYRDPSWLPELRFPHVGSLRQYKLDSNIKSEQNPSQSQTIASSSSSPLGWLNFDKKINTYYFTFYNWYFFEISFVDLSYDSYVEFKVFVEDQLHDRWIVRTGFNLDQSFYPDGGQIKGKGEGCCSGRQKEKGMNFDIRSSKLNITIRQNTIRNMSGDRHDGYQYGRFWYYTPNHLLDDPKNEAYKSSKTITTFNITYEGEDRAVQANITHILRHNQCFSYPDEENSNIFRHKCVGGYANGRIMMNRLVRHEELRTAGRYMNSFYNLDNNRTRAAFQGLRSTRKLNWKNGGGISNLKTNWRWKGFSAFMHCFSKNQYYSKHEKIQKERYVGLHFGRSFAKGRTQNFQDYLFYNGKIVPIHHLDYSFSQNYKTHTNITFRSPIEYEEGEGRQWQPQFEINFTVLSKQHYKEEDWLVSKNELRAYGYWSGWIDEGRRGERVDFFNITGYIQTKNSVY